MRKDQVLTIEKFKEGGESRFLIKSSREIQLTLQAIARNRTPVILYFNHEQRLFKTLLLCANEHGIWLDVSTNDEENSAFLHSHEVILVTLHQGAKVQFVCADPIIAPYASNPAYFFPLPAQIIRLQRREYFRLATTADTPLKCMIPPRPGRSTSNHEITIMDISVGGLSLSCAESGVGLQEGEIYSGCRIELPGVGQLVADVQVRNLFDVTAPGGGIIKHAGCEFMQLDGPQTMLLQRYIDIMQRKQPGNRTQ